MFVGIGVAVGLIIGVAAFEPTIGFGSRRRDCRHRGGHDRERGARGAGAEVDAPCAPSAAAGPRAGLDVRE